MTRTHERTAARRSAAQILYSGAIRDTSAASLLRAGDVDCIEGTVSDYAIRLIDGVEGARAELDERLDSISQNWAVSRMPIMDLAILRIALFEMLYVDEVPVSVSINEAVEMAKAFGGEDDSPRFINGMLGNIARQLEGADVEGADAQAADAEGELADVVESEISAEAGSAEGEEPAVGDAAAAVGPVEEAAVGNAADQPEQLEEA